VFATVTIPAKHSNAVGGPSNFSRRIGLKVIDATGHVWADRPPLPPA
jgi:hypothetical protein